jgi:hypothetical protein
MQMIMAMGNCWKMITKFGNGKQAITMLAGDKWCLRMEYWVGYSSEKHKIWEAGSSSFCY